MQDSQIFTECGGGRAWLVPPKRGKSICNMNKKLRTIPYPRGSAKRAREIEFIVRYMRLKREQAVREVDAINDRARNAPTAGERCGAKTRRGTPCRCKALPSGRCKFHGGLSTGPKTAAGKAKSAANLPRRGILDWA